MRETFHEPLGLRSFANARRTDENDAGGTFELLSGHPMEIYILVRGAAEKEVGYWRRDPGLRNCSWQREKLEASETDILQPHVDIERGMYLCTKKRVDAQYCDRR